MNSGNVYYVRIEFIKDGTVVEEMIFRRVIDRSPQGAITKAFHRTRIRKGSNGQGHENYGCEKLAVEVKFVGQVA